ncbi:MULTISPECIES: FecR family protein [unclassified Stenotrophomonas]|uniref:FecR family protein n=1 Tax=unclassified Stenotrophomonas TaxID=196198 RepID=UPI0025E908F9|nr:MULTISPECIES: FecR family protein [unclassified Stenotrophomonas]
MNTTPSPLQDFPSSAADWLARLLSPECNATDHAAFEDWLAVSPQNVLDYAEAEHIHQLTGILKADPRLREMTPAPASHVSIARRKRTVHRSFAWAAALLLAVCGGLWLLTDSRTTSSPTEYATEVGKQRHLDLPDGSTLLLDTNTRIQVSYQPAKRHVTLLRGQIQANVAHDGNRPFVVTSGIGSIRALGTVFQVKQLDDGTSVALLEGRVIVSTEAGPHRDAIELRPMQELTYDAEGKLESPRTIEPDHAESWTQGRLVFKEERLADLIAEFNRYSSDQLVLSQSELGEIKVSGAFNASDQPALLSALREGWGLQAQSIGNNRIELSELQQ